MPHRSPQALGPIQGVQTSVITRRCAFSFNLAAWVNTFPGPSSPKLLGQEGPDPPALASSIWACCSTRLQPGPSEESLMARQPNGVGFCRQPEAQQDWTVVSCRVPKPIPTAAGTIGGEAPKTPRPRRRSGQTPWAVVKTRQRKTRALPKGIA